MKFLAQLHARPLSTLLVFALSLTCAGLGGCIDEATLTQQQAAKKINETIAAANKALAEITTSDPEATRASAESLRRIAASATSSSGASANSKAALALVAVQLQMQAALLDSALIEPLEQVVITESDNAMMFTSLHKHFVVLAKSAIQEVPAEAREVLQKDHDASAMNITVLSAQSTKLKATIDTAQESISANQDNAIALEKQANVLKQKAAAAGPIGGFPMTVESQKTITDSRKLNNQAATIDLNTQSAQLERRISLNTENAYQSRITRNKVDMDTLDQIEGIHKASVNDLTKLSQRYQELAMESAKSMRVASEKLNTLYDTAIESLEKAMSLAQQATSGGGEMAKCAKSDLRSAQLALAGMLERRIGFSALAISGFSAVATLNDGAQWSKDATAAQTLRAASTVKAIETFELVLGAMPEGGGDEKATQFRNGIEIAKANYAGTKPPIQSSTAVNSDANASTPSESPTGNEAKSPAKDGATDSPADPNASDPANAPPADPNASDPANAPPADPNAGDPANAPPADPNAGDPANAPPADPNAGDPAKAPPADPNASDPANAPPADPPADPTAPPPA